MNPRVSVIIPVYNTEPYLRRCLDSVVNQTLREIEIICVDDRSTDKSLSILKEYENGDSRVRVIVSLQNEGEAASRNKALDAVRGEYIGFCDSDDFVDLDFFEKLYDKAKESGADIAKGNVILHSPNNESPSLWNINNKVRKGKVYFNSQFWSAIYKTAFVYDNDIFFPIGICYAPDSVFLTKAVCKVDNIELVDDVHYHYIRREGSLDFGKLSDEKAASIITVRSNLNINILNESNLNKEAYAIMAYKNLENLFGCRFRVSEGMLAKIANACISLYNKSKFKQEVMSIDDQPWHKLVIFGDTTGLVAFVKKELFGQQRFLINNIRSKILQKNKIAVSVVVPVYNTAPYLRRCLDSLVGQTLHDIEIICIDDMSTDESLTILNEYKKMDSRLRVIAMSQNMGPSTARNSGIDAARGEYIGFVDSDDWVESGFYKSLFNVAKSKDTDAARGMLSMDGFPGTKDPFVYGKYYNTLARWNKNLCYNSFTTLIYRSNILTENNIRFPKKMFFAEDNFFLAKFVQKASSVAVQDDAIYHYVWRDNSNLNRKFFTKEIVDQVAEGLRNFRRLLNDADLDKADYCFLYLNLIVNTYHDVLLNFCSNEFLGYFTKEYMEAFGSCRYSRDMASFILTKLFWTKEEIFSSALYDKINADELAQRILEFKALHSTRDTDA
jgi:glycosyltransferase involved in cell wall biosynthesis